MADAKLSKLSKAQRELLDNMLFDAEQARAIVKLCHQNLEGRSLRMARSAQPSAEPNA